MVSLRFLGSWVVIASLFLVGSTLGCDSSSGSGKDPSDASAPDAGKDSGGADGATAPDAAQVELPGSFSLEQPENGDSNVSVTPTLSWSSASAADTYTVEVSTDSNFATTPLVNLTDITSTSATLTTALSRGTIYYWRVTAVNTAGSRVATNAGMWMSAPVDVASNPRGVAITPDGSTAVVSHGGNPGSVTLVNLNTFAIDTLSLAGQPSSEPGSVAITPDGTTALVAQLHNVLLVNLTSKVVSGSFASPCASTTLYGLAVKPDGSAFVMPDFNAGCVNDVVDIVALPGATLTTSFPLGTSATAFGVAVTTDGSSALITRGVTTTSIRRIDLSNGTVTTIADTSSSYGVAVTPDGASALVSSGPGDTIKLISLSSNTVTGSIDYASNSDVGNLAISPDGQTAVVAGDFDLGILSIPTQSVRAQLPAAPRSVAITPDGKRALFTGASATGKLHVVKLP